MREGFFGKFRGVVTDNQDPMQLGRIRARVPDIMSDQESGWALPCAAFGGDKTGLFAVPKKGAGVWIEFEHGDPDFPIWSGCWWGGLSEIPTDLLTPPPPSGKVMIVTPGGHSIMLDDTPGTGGIILKTSGGQKLSLTSTGIEIDNGNGATIKLSGPQVSINSGAMEIV